MDICTAKWVWCKGREPNTYCYARGWFDVPNVAIQGVLQIVADSRYQVWVNGRYVGQGPTPFKRPYVFVDSYDVTGKLRVGKNLVAVLGDYHGVVHCTYTPGVPGILVRVEVVDADGKMSHLESDEKWKAEESRAYVKNVPRRTWATAWCEYYDARKEETGWEGPDFDDSRWKDAQEVEQGEVKLFPRMVAPLKEYYADGQKFIGAWNAETGVPEISSGKAGAVGGKRQVESLTRWLDEEVLKPRVSAQLGKAWMPMKVASGEDGLAITVDFGKETAGQIELDIEAPAGVVIDICPSELLREGRPWCYRKGGEYAKRYTTREGRQRWRSFGYDGFRYVQVVVRGPHPEVTIYRVDSWCRESALEIRAKFECDDPAVNRIWDINCNTTCVCRQDVHIDCPTREQTSAFGEAWTGLWAIYMTGNGSALRHVMLTAEHTQTVARDLQIPDGLLPSYPFSEFDSFTEFDASMVVVWCLWLYLWFTGDRGLTERLIPVIDRILDWFRKGIGPTGLIELDAHKLREEHQGTIFIDHPGFPSHNCPHQHPGLDRRGINAAFNFFFIHDLDAEANILQYLEQGERAKSLREEANKVRAAAEKLFYNAEQGAYVDGYYEGKQSQQISQQTNALAVTSGTCPPGRVRKVLERVLNWNDSQLCLATPYFWIYMAEALCVGGMHERMWKEVVRLWNEMAEKGATAWWETFLGDELDSLCHMYSCIPGYLILSEILGVKPAEAGFARVIIRPRFDLIQKAKGSVPVGSGEVKVEWQGDAQKSCNLTVDLRIDSPGVVALPRGWETLDTKAAEIHVSANSVMYVVCQRVAAP